jgi:hypothetical protein
VEMAPASRRPDISDFKNILAADQLFPRVDDEGCRIALAGCVRGGRISLTLSYAGGSQRNLTAAAKRSECKTDLACHGTQAAPVKTFKVSNDARFAESLEAIVLSKSARRNMPSFCAPPRGLQEIVVAYHSGVESVALRRSSRGFYRN